MATLQSRARVVVADHQRRVLEVALDVAVDQARKNATKRTGKWAGSIRRVPVVVRGHVMSSRVGSSLVSAVAHEKGAYIQAKAHPTLVFQVGGRWVRPKAVRLPARPVIRPAVILLLLFGVPPRRLRPSPARRYPGSAI